MTGTFIIAARNDGRGGVRVFGLSPQASKGMVGKSFHIGDKVIKITTDGRINIPKSIMNDYGITGNDGRKRVTISFSSTSKRKGERRFAGYINKPLARDKNRKNGWKVISPRKKTDRALKPSDSRDYNWSPVE